MEQASAEPLNPSSPPPVSPELIKGVCTAYAELLRRQGTTAGAFVRWSESTERAQQFAWLGGAFEREALFHGGQPITLRAGSPLFQVLHDMRSTVTLNPYEKELLYGYPYVIGRRDKDALRGPLLVMPVRIEGEGEELQIVPADDVVRFNSLAFALDGDPAVRELAIRRVIAATPPFPLGEGDIRHFAEVVVHTLGVARGDARLDGTLTIPPSLPTRGDGLSLVDQAAVFVAPKTSYFLVSDLMQIGTLASTGMAQSSLGPLLRGAGGEAQVHISDDECDRRRVYYPFPSNRSQRRVALLLEDPRTTVVRVEGPPGTGKSLTIANLACHLAATGKSVLITSQKDKALQVVDEMLRELQMPELPMTLLRQDKDSKRELLRRLEAVKKERGREEVGADYSRVGEVFASTAEKYIEDAGAYASGVEWEAVVERTHRNFAAAHGLRRLIEFARFRYTKYKSSRLAPRCTDEIAEAAAQKREALRVLAVRALHLGREFAVAAATRQERQRLRELSKVLQRDQNRYRNFSLFDRLKEDSGRAQMLLGMLPVWIMAPEDCARLFPCVGGLFDVVIVDEASQVDLPSITPVICRGKKAVIVGDTRQMQPRRFAFLNQNVMAQAWEHTGMERLDPERWLYPGTQSLLTLSATRAEEETLLDEHFRSLPPIIAFSNKEWYEDKLRIMTDGRQKRFGTPNQPIIELHHVPEGRISNGSQENEVEARALVARLGRMVVSEDYAGASIGVISLFEEQAALLQQLVGETIPEEEWEEHDLVVLNPDGFQGDERDVILYSLSWDDQVMPRQALSQRQREHPHEQGMLNVAFTRARDEVHIFHSAPIKTFTKADGSLGALTRWLLHCQAAEAVLRPVSIDSRLGRVDSEFEAEVARALRGRGLRVLHQYPACGFHIDLVCERDGMRVAVECDGEHYHRDERGQPKLEDLEREAILRRAGWNLVRIPYRKWLQDPAGQVTRVLGALDAMLRAELDEVPSEVPVAAPRSGDVREEPVGPAAAIVSVSKRQAVLLEAMRSGLAEEDALFYSARDALHLRRLTTQLRRDLKAGAEDLKRRGLVTIEAGEYFLTPAGRTVRTTVLEAARRPYGRQYRRWRR